MLKYTLFLVFSAFFFCPLPILAQSRLDSNQAASQQLFSPSVGQRFYEIAYELANSGDTKPETEQLGTPEDVSSRQLEQAMIFLTATMNLDSRAGYVLPDMIKLACRCGTREQEELPGTQLSQRDYPELVNNLLARYLSESADLEVARQAVRYLLERLNSREEREKLLEDMLTSLGGTNAALDSELATLLGLLKAEKADSETAPVFFMQAFNNNKYNRLAFEKLAELLPEHIEPAMYLEHLRLALDENPLDIEAALNFAGYTRQLQLYQTAADAYEYCVDLLRFLYPSQALPAEIYSFWAISNYNTQRNQQKCLQIAEEFRQSGRFDLFLEVIAAKAAAKIGDSEQANRILQTAEEKAVELTAHSQKLTDDESQTANYEQLAWFYCFALPDAGKALDWANKAYSIEPNSPMAADVLAYSLVMNGQTDLAKPLINTDEQNQIGTLALAQIQLAQQQRDLAIKTLKSAIAADPGTLQAEHAKEILAQNGGEYIAPIAPDIILTAMESSFGEAVVPEFLRPEQIISVQLNFHGTKFYYGSELNGSVVITNNSSRPLVISDNGLFKGNIRIDADISGDINKKIPNLVSVRIRPALPVEPGRSILIPLRLVVAELRDILLTCPQASLEIEFTVYIDPQYTAQDKLTNRLIGIAPARAAVKRPGINLDGKYLRNRVNSLSKGQQGQKTATAQLFAGLLAEQAAMTNREPLYKVSDAEWMPDLLKSALTHATADDDWVVKVHTMAAMLSLSLDYQLISAVAENLNDTHWPVRLMAIYLLAKSQDSNFGKVLDHSAKYDSNKLVRDMAVALGAAVPEVQEPAGQPTTDNSKKQPLDSKD